MKLSAVAASIRDQALSPIELVDRTLDAADRTHHLNPLAEREGGRAGTRSRPCRRGGGGRIRGPLHGVLVTVKDLFVVDGFRMCAGTRAPLPVLPPGEATAVRRLRGAGAVIVATTNLVEIAFGISGQNPWTGDVRNPRDARRQPGGSSSGSAVAVATGIGLSSVGTDTGGSLRIPAALCGVTTIKPPTVPCPSTECWRSARPAITSVPSRRRWRTPRTCSTC